jgi:hypothetical protein
MAILTPEDASVLGVLAPGAAAHGLLFSKADPLLLFDAPAVVRHATEQDPPAYWSPRRREDRGRRTGRPFCDSGKGAGGVRPVRRVGLLKGAVLHREYLQPSRASLNPKDRRCTSTIWRLKSQLYVSL